MKHPSEEDPGGQTAEAPFGRFFRFFPAGPFKERVWAREVTRKIPVVLCGIREAHL